MLAYSGQHAEQASYKGCLDPHVPAADVVDLSLPDHRHGFVTRQSSPGGAQAAKAQARPHQALDPAVVLLDDVVQVLALA